MKTKKFFSVIAIIMAMTLLVGCGSSATSTTETATKSDAAESTETTQTEAAETEAAAEETESEEAETATVTAEKITSEYIEKAIEAGYPEAKEGATVLSLGAIAFNPYDPSPAYQSMRDELLTIISRTDELSNGELSIEGFWGSTLGGNPSLQDQVMMGEIDMHFGQPMSSNDTRYGLWNLPYIFNSFDEIMTAVNPVDGPVFDLCSEWFEENGVHLLLISTSFMRGFINNKHEVKLPEDISDLKVRTYEDEIVNTFWSGLGTASIIPGSEIYSSLQTKTVDGAEFHVTGISSMNLQEVTSFYTNINWQWTNGGCWTINLDTWNSLTEEQQNILTQVALEAFNIQAAEEIEFTDLATQNLIDEYGFQVTELTDEEHQAWVDYARSLDEEFKEMIGEEDYNEYMAAVDEAKAKLDAGNGYQLP